MRRAFLHILAASAVLAIIAPPAHGQSFLNRSIHDWLNDLNAKNPPDVRRSATFALGKIGAEGDAGRVLDALLKSLHDDADAAVRDGAAYAVGDMMTELGDSGQIYWARADAPLQEALKDAAPGVRRSAAYALGSFGAAATPARDALIAALADDKPSVRQNAAWALGELGQGAGQDGVAQLRGLLKDDDPLVRRDAMHALGDIGNPVAHAAVSAMMKAAGTEGNGVVRKAAVEALSKLVGPDDRADSKSLYPLLSDKDPETRYGAAVVLATIGGPEAAQALPVLREALLGDDPHFQELAAAAVGGLGKDGGSAVDLLGQVLTQAKEPDVRRNAALSLSKIGPPAAKVLPQIVQALQYHEADADSQYNGIRVYAAEALNHILMPGIEPAIPAVLKIIRSDPDPVVRMRCLFALFDVEDLDRYKITPVLTALLDDTGQETAVLRWDAARLLAFRLRERAPDKTADVLLQLLRAQGVVEFKGVDAKTNGVGSEGAGGKTTVNQDLGGDGRWMGAQGLGFLG
ncbi:MAG TPA: HEAT repeat domain-containing protein, partial [Gemmataceae bacterium]|nr:HEAT repeat domain-containing protein [Gemmataceae bacterium]